MLAWRSRWILGAPKPLHSNSKLPLPKKNPSPARKKSVPWEQARQRLMCWFSTFSAWQHVWDRLSKKPYFSGALHRSFHSTELLICFFWQQSLPMCELQRPCQINSHHNCQTARPICLLRGNCYLPDRHGWLSLSALPRANSTLRASLC